jgi:hypothetical protein
MKASCCLLRSTIPGVALPPHLSPFAEGDEEYLPQRRMFLDELKKKRSRAVDVSGEGATGDVNADLEKRRLKKLSAEAKGVKIDDSEVEGEAEEQEESQLLVTPKTKAKELKTDATNISRPMKW